MSTIIITIITSLVYNVVSGLILVYSVVRDLIESKRR